MSVTNWQLRETVPSALLTRPPRLALTEKRTDPLARVIGAERGDEAALLGLDPLVEVRLGRDLLDLLDCHRRLPGELARPRERCVEQLVVGNDLVRESVL